MPNLKILIYTIYCAHSAAGLSAFTAEKWRMIYDCNDNYIELIENMKLYLTKEDITIILLHLIDDLKFDDIALKLNRKVKTIKTKYYRALKKYQKMKGVK